MKDRLYIKIGIIVLLSALLLIPLTMIKSQISERKYLQSEVVRNIAESAAGQQTLISPLLAIEYQEKVLRKKPEKDDDKYEYVPRQMLIPAQSVNITGRLNTELRSRGIYQARLFHLDGSVSGKFELAAQLGMAGSKIQNVSNVRAYLVFGVADVRGITNDPEVVVNGRTYRFIPGTEGMLGGNGVHVALGTLDPQQAHHFEFSFPLKLTGSEQLAIAPTANLTNVTLDSDWRHPSFRGRFLPTARTVSDKGFEAAWQVSHLSRNFERAVNVASQTERYDSGNGETLGVALVDPVNVYLQAERAVKYGVLFVVLTFAAFFLTEVLRSLPIHPMQYLLAGLALASFFLLLVALSEHIAFLFSYIISAGSCVILIGSYLSGALGSRVRGLLFGGGIAVLYAVLYGVLISEDNALLMGTLLLFVALGTIMITTRRFDWYRLGSSAATAAAAQATPAATRKD